MNYVLAIHSNSFGTIKHIFPFEQSGLELSLRASILQTKNMLI